MDLYSGPSRFDLEDSNPPKNGESGDGELGSGIIWQKLGEGQFRDLEALQGAYQYWRGRARGTTTGGSLNSYIDQAWSHLLDTDPPPFGPPTIISPHHIWNLVLVDELLFSLDGTDPKVIVYIAFSELVRVRLILINTSGGDNGEIWVWWFGYSYAMVTTKGAGEFDPSAELKLEERGPRMKVGTVRGLGTLEDGGDGGSTVAAVQQQETE
ncbi:hypothetical protein BY996DRAFT_6416686 [Phakopsora pachyrhizi]|nr:hypothetical protein BY996DRAFT_6416686 [Phakopsora pachyrhizi]